MGNINFYFLGSLCGEIFEYNGEMLSFQNRHLRWTLRMHKDSSRLVIHLLFYDYYRLCFISDVPLSRPLNEDKICIFICCLLHDLEERNIFQEVDSPLLHSPSRSRRIGVGFSASRLRIRNPKRVIPSQKISTIKNSGKNLFNNEFLDFGWIKLLKGNLPI